MGKPEKKFIDPEFFLKPYLYKAFDAKEKGIFQAADVYDRYRKRLMLNALSKFSFEEKDILQVGVSESEYLKMISKKNPKSLFGVGIFHELIEEVRKDLEEIDSDISQFNGQILPYPNGIFDVVFSAAFLQNYAESKPMKTVLAEMARVSCQKIIILDDIFDSYIKTEFYRGRELKFYVDFLQQFKYELISKQFISTGGTDKMRQILRDFFNPKGLEILGAPLSLQAQKIEKMIFSIANSLDGMISGNGGLTMMVFEKPIVEYY